VFSFDHTLPPKILTGCFSGVYLSQLCQFNRMPDLIDPTAPNEAVSIDPISANFNAPAHPEVFASLTPLPSSMQLEPLINVQKQRLIAGVIKSLVAGQHLASRVQFPIDKKLFQRCLRLRGLDADMLQRAFTMHPD
jgi:GDP/GTP exchange factor required for growth at low temperature